MRAITSVRYSAALVSWSLASIDQLRVGPSKLPLAPLVLAAAIALRSWSMEMPCAASAWTLAWMRTAGRCPPDRETRPTPEICAILLATRWSTRFCTSAKARVSEVTPRLSTGASAGLTLA